MEASEKKNRLLQAATAILQAAKNQKLNIVVLNKALFYLDLYSLRDIGEPVSHNTFMALQQGPVVAKYPERLVKPLSDAGIAIQEVDGPSKPVKLTGAGGDLSLLSEPQIQLARTIAGWFSGATSADASEFSHKNPGWKIAFDAGMGRSGRPKPIDLHIAMQQIVDVDPWLSEPLDVCSSEALAMADRNEGETW